MGQEIVYMDGTFPLGHGFGTLVHVGPLQEPTSIRRPLGWANMYVSADALGRILRDPVIGSLTVHPIYPLQSPIPSQVISKYRLAPVYPKRL